MERWEGVALGLIFRRPFIEVFLLSLFLSATSQKRIKGRKSLWAGTRAEGLLG